MLYTPTAAFGGFAGASVSLAMTTGFARSVYSNEAGWGTSPMIHASAKVDHPIKEGLVGVFEVSTSTFIICTITALAVLVTGLWSTGIHGANLTLTAFESELGMFGRIVIAISVFLFGITTASGIYVQSEAIFNHVIKNPKTVKVVINAYRFLYPLVALIMVFIAVLNRSARRYDMAPCRCQHSFADTYQYRYTDRIISCILNCSMIIKRVI